MTEDEQLKDVVVVISSVSELTEFAITRVYRFDLEGDVKTFIESIASHKQIIEGARMFSDHSRKGLK